jgi:putative acetyltransferase
MQLYKNTTIESLRHSSREMVRELGFLEYEKYYLGLSPSQAHALLQINEQGCLTSQDLASFLRLEKSTASRLVKALFAKKLVFIQDNPHDARSKLISCSHEGLQMTKEINTKASNQVKEALNYLTEEEQNMLAKSLASYSIALKKSRLLQSYKIREIAFADNLALNALIKSILADFGAARAGFAFQDESLNNMYDNYNKSNSHYLVVEKDKKIYGGVGLAPLAGGEDNFCELQKLYLSNEVRGLGLGKILTVKILDKAKSLGYQYCYLETLSSMEKANQLYIKLGFKKLAKPMGDTGHFGCDNWYLKEL